MTNSSEVSIVSFQDFKNACSFYKERTQKAVTTFNEIVETLSDEETGWLFEEFIGWAKDSYIADVQDNGVLMKCYFYDCYFFIPKEALDVSSSEDFIKKMISDEIKKI
jgi:hypothetical protein